MEKIKIDLPIIVEGKYDKIKLDSLLDANIIKTDGFGIFSDNELMCLIRRLADRYGKIIVLTDSDGAGRVIRAHISCALQKEKIINLYTPAITGKERRKNAPSSAGLLGVEGTDAEVLRTLFAPYENGSVPTPRGDIKKNDFYADGLSGTPGAEARRAALARNLELPHEMSSNALLTAVNMLLTREEYREQINILMQNERQ